jgi:hypothetical protein
VIPQPVSEKTFDHPEVAEPSAGRTVSEQEPPSIVYGDEYMTVEEELKLPYPRERIPVFSAGAGARGPIFNQNTHPQFFQNSPYNGPQTSTSPRFWTNEHAIYYTRVLFESRKLFPHEFPDIRAMRGLDCFCQLLDVLDDAYLTRVFAFEHPWNREVIL